MAQMVSEKECCLLLFFGSWYLYFGLIPLKALVSQLTVVILLISNEMCPQEHSYLNKHTNKEKRQKKKN